MSDYKHHMKSHFAGCRHLANAYDPHRQRDVKLFHIPGDFTVVGVDDGTDSWIAPTMCNPFSVDVVKLYERIRSGAIIEAPGLHRVRVVVRPPTTQKVAAVATPPPAPVPAAVPPVTTTPRVIIRNRPHASNNNIKRVPIIRR